MKRAKFIDTETARQSLKGNMNSHAQDLSKELLAAQQRIRELETFVSAVKDGVDDCGSWYRDRARALLED